MQFMQNWDVILCFILGILTFLSSICVSPCKRMRGMQIKLLLCCKKMLIMGILTGSLKARSLATLYDIKSSDNKSAIKNKIYQHFQSVVRKRLDVHIEQKKKRLKTYALFKTNFKYA